MTELSFSKQFLSTLASRSIRIPADFCEDPRKLPSRTPYTLPATKKPKTKRAKLTSTSTSIPTANVTIKSLRGSQINHTLSDTPLNSTILTLKHNLSTATGIPIDKLKLLIKGKVLTDLKTLTEFGIEEDANVSVTVMVMGGASPAPPPASVMPADEKKVGPNETGVGKEEDLMDLEEEQKEVAKKSVLSDGKFWEELHGFLKERLGSGEVAEEPEDVLKAFRDAWVKRLS